MANADSNLLFNSESSTSPTIVSDSLAFGVVFAIALTVVQRGVGFLRGILFCRFMTEQELGQWSMVFSFLMLLAPFAVLGLPGSFGRFVEHFKERGQLGTFIRRISKISCVLTLCLAAAMYFAPVQFSQLFFRSPDYSNIVFSMTFAIVLVTASNFLMSLMESLRQVRLATIMRFIQGIAFGIFGCLLIFGWEDAAAAATFGFGVACICSCVPAASFLYQNRNALKDTGLPLGQIEMWKRVAPYAIWTWACNLVWNMFEVADRYMLIHWSNVPADQAHGFVGQYHSGRVVPLLLVGLAVVLEGLIMPYMTAAWEKNRPHVTSQLLILAMKMMAYGFTICSIVILMLSPLLFDVVLQGKYDAGLAVLPLTLVYSTWFSLFLIGQLYLWVAERGKYVFCLTTIGLVLNLILNAWLIPMFGLWGAVIATATATLFCLAMTIQASRFAGAAFSYRIWIAILFPLVVLLPLPLSIAAGAALLATTWRTSWILDLREKGVAFDQFQKLKSKFV